MLGLGKREVKPSGPVHKGVPPEEKSVRVCPVHTGPLFKAFATGKGLTTMEADDEAVHERAEPTTVYCVVTEGLDAKIGPRKPVFQV